MRIGARADATRGAVRVGPDAAAVAAAAVSDFVVEHGSGPGAPIAVVVAAFNEVDSVAAVVGAIPSRLSDLETEIIVVDDGSSDDTGAAARAAGALVCRLAINLGQGHALRVGYRLARQRGVRLITTLDADGQFDPAELPALVAPLVADDADFVNGSRRLGRSEVKDPVRRVGVVVFSTLISLLTGTPITDPASGMRAIREEVVERVPLRQTQFQTSELLIGVIAHGFRVTEVPVTVYARAGGLSKKGGNLAYGFRFGRVVLTTWWSSRPSARRQRT